jgi:DNA polymerase-3 subunit epsilon
MRHTKRHILLYAVGLVIALFAALVVLDSTGSLGVVIPKALIAGSAAFVLVVVLPAYFLLIVHVNDTFRSLDRLRGFVVMMQTDEAEELPRPLPGELPRETQRLLDAIDALLAGRLARQALPVRQLETVLGSMPDGILVINHAGQVSLVNAAAKQLLGQQELVVGTSVYDALSRDGLDTGIEEARRAGGPVETALPTIDGRRLTARLTEVDASRGAILIFHAAEPPRARSMDHDLGLLELPPKPQAFADETPLGDLPFFVFDLETTGLDVQRDAIVSVGGVRMLGGTIYRSATIDRLVHPGCSIPARATAIHGITNEMVAGASSFDGIWSDLQALMQGTVLVGHNVGFDIAHLGRAAREAGIAWGPQPFLCTYLLAGALDLTSQPPGLDALARECGVRVRGRHTALGDCLVTAEIFSRLLPRLLDHGVETLGQAVDFAGRRTDLLKQQRESGWWVGEDR